jgi:hypothetical protein
MFYIYREPLSFNKGFSLTPAGEREILELTLLIFMSIVVSMIWPRS